MNVLFQPGRIGSLEIRNRIVKSSQSTALSNRDGTVSQRSVNHYKRLAEGGVGLIMTEYTYIDEDASKAIHNQLGNTSREHIPGMGWLVDEVHAAGAKIGMQLAHGGRQKFLGTAPIKAASSESWDYVEMQYGEKPVPMTLAEIEQVMVDFGDAALRAVQARFDLVEVHAGHGYLITNFLSPFTNKRTDEYGGPFENRIRLLIGIVRDIRKKIPATTPLSIRISVVDYEKEGITIEETIELCRRLEAEGVDVIHCSGGHHALMQYEVSPWYMPRALHQWAWEQIKAQISIPVMASGSIVAPDVAADILRSGTADFISLGRPLLADPDWALKASEGRVSDIVPCIRCNDGCLHRGLNVGRSAGCTVNPSMGEEYRYPVEQSTRKSRIAVVGAGPAGLNAACVLHERGHEVVLFEQKELGGLLNVATRLDMKKDLRALLEHLIHRVTSVEIEIRKERATVESLKSENFDKVLLATGRKPRGFASVNTSRVAVFQAHEIADAHAIEGPVVIVGAGLSGCETALWLKQAAGQEVVLIDSASTVLSRGYVFTDEMGMPDLLAEHGVIVRTHSRAVDVVDEGVIVQDEHAGTQSLLPASTVIVACGYEESNPLFESLDTLAGASFSVERLGSARKEGRILDALHDAFFTARRY